MATPIFSTVHLVKSEELNHHGTLFAGRTAEWFVESGFVAAATMTKPQNIVCLKIHGMTFTAPVTLGSLAKFESRVVYTGKTKIVVLIVMSVNEIEVVRGFISFVHVDADNKPLPHGITIVPETDEEKDLFETGKNLR